MTLRTKKSNRAPRMSPAQIDARKHTGLIGFACLTRKNMEAIAASPTANSEAKALASHIAVETYALERALRGERI